MKPIVRRWERSSIGSWYFHENRLCVGYVMKRENAWTGFVWAKIHRRIGPFKTLKAAKAEMEREVNHE